MDENPEEHTELDNSVDLENCPRCGEQIETIIWGITNCPRCGLHFECC
jgi:uncharacterized protein (UPF0212 family)